MIEKILVISESITYYHPVNLHNVEADHDT